MQVKCKSEKELIDLIPESMKDAIICGRSLYDAEIIRLRSIADRVIPVTLHTHAPGTEPPIAYKYLLFKDGDKKYYGYIYPDEVEEVIE